VPWRWLSPRDGDRRLRRLPPSTSLRSVRITRRPLSPRCLPIADPEPTGSAQRRPAGTVRRRLSANDCPQTTVRRRGGRPPNSRHPRPSPVAGRAQRRGRSGICLCRHAWRCRRAHSVGALGVGAVGLVRAGGWGVTRDRIVGAFAPGVSALSHGDRPGSGGLAPS
jgi:hypothetical protein